MGKCPGGPNLLAVWWATATVEDDKVAAEESDPSEYDEVVTTKDMETIDAFLSHIIHAEIRTAYTGVGLNVMTLPYVLKMGHYRRAWQYRTLVQSCVMAARMLQW